MLTTCSEIPKTPLQGTFVCIPLTSRPISKKTVDPPESVECYCRAEPKVKPKVKQERTVSVKRGGKFPPYFLLILGIFQVTQHTCANKNIWQVRKKKRTKN